MRTIPTWDQYYLDICKVVAGRIPEGVNVLPNQVALASQLQHAVGLAWGFKLQGKPNVVMAYCGDGATSAHLFIDGVPCCDQFTAHILAHDGLIEPAYTGDVGQRVPASLTAAGLAAITEPAAA